MIETILTNYLGEKITAPVYFGEKPSKKPAEYVVIEKIDSGRINMIDAATFSLFSYSETLYEAAELNAKVKEAMFNIVELPEVSSSKLGGGSQYIDKQTKEYGYECIFNLYYME